jgi:hypothetical protein
MILRIITTSNGFLFIVLVGFIIIVYDHFLIAVIFFINYDVLLILVGFNMLVISIQVVDITFDVLLIQVAAFSIWPNEMAF